MEISESCLYNGDMRKIIAILAILLAIVVMGIVLMNSINKTISSAFSPLQRANQSMSTQIANFLHPTPTILPDPVTIIHDVRSLARLETIQYTVEKVITAEEGQGTFSFLFEDRLLLVAHGIVIAGVDLEKIAPEDMWLEGAVLNIRLPEPEVFLATLDNDKTYIYERDTGILRGPNPDLETLARQAAEKAIGEAALEDGILDTARANAESYLMRLFLDLGYADVVFVK
jgi:hypothetical protein